MKLYGRLLSSQFLYFCKCQSVFLQPALMLFLEILFFFLFWIFFKWVTSTGEVRCTNLNWQNHLKWTRTLERTLAFSKALKIPSINKADTLHTTLLNSFALKNLMQNSLGIKPGWIISASVLMEKGEWEWAYTYTLQVAPRNRDEVEQR